MKIKRIIALVLTLALGIGCFTLPAVPARAEGQGLEQDALSKVILAVKNKLEIGDEYSEFNYYFWEDGSNVNYNFDWNTQDYSKNISVSCDGEGRIDNVYFGRGDRYWSIPEKTADEMQPEAEKLLAQIVPEAEGHVELLRHYCAYYNSSYNYTFVRVENGVQMPDNSVMISVNYNTGELVNASISWLYDVKIPDATGLIGEEAAKEKINALVDMQLQYLSGWEYEENNGRYYGRGKEKVFLAYVPSDTYVAVNAKTGKVYQERTYWDRGYGENETAMAEDTADAKSAAGVNGATLSEAEIAKIEDLNNIISRDEAIAVIRNNKALLVDENLNTFTANLYNDEGKYYWSVSLRDARPEDYENDDTYRANAYARVAAEDGRIISFRSSVKGIYEYNDEEAANIKLKYSKKECRKILEDFAKETDPEKFADVKLANTDRVEPIRYDYEKDKYTYGGYSFSYDRYYKDIPFYSDYINGSVDRITGKIFNYYTDWYEGEMPEPEGVIGEDAAFDAYMSCDGYNLVYEIVTDNNKNKDGIYVSKNSVRLVYSTNIYPNLIDAFSGSQIDYNGNEYTVNTGSYTYDDIAGSKYERSIILLADMNVGVAGGKFRPDEVITKDEFAELVSMAGMLGIDSETGLKGKKKLSREAAAKAIVTILGYSKVAELDIYKDIYKDSSKISAGLEGYVAIAGSLGLIEAKAGGSFRPTSGLTRGEAAQMLYTTLKVYTENR